MPTDVNGLVSLTVTVFNSVWCSKETFSGVRNVLVRGRVRRLSSDNNKRNHKDEVGVPETREGVCVSLEEGLIPEPKQKTRGEP